MSEIDWSKAPEGAEVHFPNQAGTAECFAIFREDGAHYAYPGMTVWTRWYGESKDSLLSRFKHSFKEWSGEGLPPVGTVCEWCPNQDGWVQVEILGHDGEETWFRRAGQSISETCLRMAFFRPIRTPEQIAAELREESAKNLYLTINWNDTPSTWANLSQSRRADYFKAIDAGWNKFEIIDEPKS